MPSNIVMCKDGSCPRCQECYRFTAVPDPDPKKQNYMNSPLQPDGRECFFFMPDKSKKDNNESEG